MTTGGNFPVSDLQYNVITTLSNLLQGMESLAKYQQDATKNGDEQLAQTFGAIHDSYREGAVKLRDELARLAK
ncbi:MAG TPA: hypothetical protein VGT61_12910 [Thermomicrobiales bacterium]|jgi:hypothetical protein|nr:hypothetical protein [Thermomicrobiales bacterium]